MNKLYMMLFASMATAISLSAVQEDGALDNSRVEKTAKKLLFIAKNCEHLGDRDIHLLMHDVVGIDGSHTVEQLESILNYKKMHERRPITRKGAKRVIEGKTAFAIAQSKDCEKCHELADVLKKYTTAIEAAKLLEISHLTDNEIDGNSDLKKKMNVIVDIMDAKRAQK